MSLEFPVRYYVNLSGPSSSLRSIYNDLGNNLVGFIDDGVLLGHPEAPGSGGPIWDGDSWKSFDGRGYAPVMTKIGNVEIVANPTAPRTQYIQDKPGAVALMGDVYGISPTVTLPPGATAVDWDAGKNFSCNLTNTTLLQMQHSRPGMEIYILATNKGSQWDIIWDDSIEWPGVPPATPHALPGQSVSGLYALRNISGTVYGESQNQEIALSTHD